jgi:hypothetical protein
MGTASRQTISIFDTLESQLIASVRQSFARVAMGRSTTSIPSAARQDVRRSQGVSMNVDSSFSGTEQQRGNFVFSMAGLPRTLSTHRIILRWVYGGAARRGNRAENILTLLD